MSNSNLIELHIHPIKRENIPSIQTSINIIIHHYETQPNLTHKDQKNNHQFTIIINIEDVLFFNLFFLVGRVAAERPQGFDGSCPQNVLVVCCCC